MISRSRILDALLAALATAVASWSVAGLLQGREWVWPMLTGLAVVAAVGILARAVRLPAWAVVTAQAALAGIVLTWIFAPGHHWFGLPRTSGLETLRALLGQGVVTIQEESVPAPATAGLVFVVVASMVAVGLAVDAIGVTLRSPALAGLPLLVVLTVTASGTGKALSPQYFLATAAVWLPLVARQSISTVRSWSNQHAWSRTTTVTGPAETVVERSTRRHRTWATSLGVVTVVLAVLLPGFLPHLSPTTVLQGLGRGPEVASGEVTFTETLDLAADLGSRSNQPVLRYRTDDARSAPLRVRVTPLYSDGRWWPVVRSPGTTTAEPPLEPVGGPEVERDEWSLTVVLNELKSPQVALPHPLVEADFGQIDWDLDPQTGVAYVRERPETYEATAWRPAGPLPEGIGEGPPPDVVEEPLLQVDVLSSDLVVPLATELTAGAENQIQAARAIQGYLRGPEFFYSLTLADPVVGEDGRTLDPISHFLTTKQGYCTQFASAMVMMARAVGIPARMAVGFLPGDREADGSRTIVRADAHAWPELYINGLGWTRFEPTPGGRSGAAPVYLTEADMDGLTPATPEPTVEATEPPVTDPRMDNAVGGSTGSSWFDDVLGLLADVAPPLAILLLLALVVPSAGRWRREAGTRAARDDGGRVEGHWRSLVLTLTDLGLPPPVGATPRQVAEHYRDAAALSGAPATAMGRAAARLERARYAPGATEVGTMAQDVGLVVAKVRSALPWRARLRAWWWPRSGRDQIRAMATRVADLGRARRPVRPGA
ncbi:transglutaminase family protein [Georgenia subflava]|uniref:DUF4129 domain-containing protein n=1 Tax=Georgenia subflava TaxID=1622177 RepID=A0A6N7EPM6_9MICO|nr:DUF3488 and transglutaminase-like domain-containing protein [Georgenia subflava]MPV38465.1 DUF4129 domain-containing protein [Georgenia subflava]